MKKFVNFFVEVRQEALKVIWPSKREVFNSTLIVILAVILFSILFMIIDSLSYKLVSCLNGLGV